MNKDIGKRLGCAALATQMLLSPVAQAASPLREGFDSTVNAPVVSLAENRLTQGAEKRQSFPHLSAVLAAEQTEKKNNTFDGEPAPGEALSPVETTTSPETTPTPEETPPVETTVCPETTPVPEETPPVETTVSPETTPVPEETPPVETTVPPETTPVPEETPPVEATASPETTPTPVETTPAITEPPLQEEAPPVENPALMQTELISQSEPGYDDMPMAPFTEVIAIFGFGPDYDVSGRNAYKGKYNIEYDNWSLVRDPVTLDPGAADTDPSYDWEGPLYDSADMGGGVAGSGRLYAQGFTPYLLDGWMWQWQDDGSGELAFIWDPVTQKTYFNRQLMTAEELPRLPNKIFTDEWYIFGSANDNEIPFEQKFYWIDPTNKQQMEYPDSASWNEVLGNAAVENGALISYPYLDDALYNEERDTVQFDPAEPMDSYFRYMNVNKYLPLIGKWVDSNNATATDLTLKIKAEAEARTEAKDGELTLYQVGSATNETTYANMTAKELEALTAGVGFEPEVEKYFTRVPYEVEDLVFALEAYEPGSKVELSVTYGDSSPTVYTSDTLKYVDEYRGKDIENGLYQYPSNSHADPARGKWSFKETKDSIHLEPTSKEVKYNVVTLTVTAPDGTVKVYTIYVQRMTVPHMLLDPGNTPFGMIDRDAWTGKTKTKTEAKNAFKSQGRFGTGMQPTADPINNGGFVNNNNGLYYDTAWGNKSGTPDYENLDQDSKTIVAFQNMPFRLPFFQVYDAVGNTTVWTTEEDGAGSGDGENASLDPVTWKLTLDVVDKLSPEVVKETGSGNTITFEGEGTDTEIDLTGYNIKPGVYELHYTYEDPYDKMTHTGKDKTTSFDEPEDNVDRVGYTRKVVVLPLRGDVDMDGAVTPADGILLKELLDTHFFDEMFAKRPDGGLQSYPAADAPLSLCLYYYRVCSVNGDSRVDQYDYEALLGGEMADLSHTASCNYFYLPLISPTASQTARKTTNDPDKATIALEYWGRQGAAQATDKLDYEPGASTVFWMAATLKDAERLGDLAGELTSLTLTLTYDSAYVRPHVEGTDWASYMMDQNPQWADWTVYGPQTDVKPTAHSSKAETGLKEPGESQDTLREIRFSIAPNSENEKGKALTDGEMLRIPFELIAYPTVEADDKGNKLATLIELTLGMRDLSVTTTAASAVWNNDTSWLTGADGRLCSVTTNLADNLNYGGTQPIHLGVDRTPMYHVYVQLTTDDPVYGEPFTSANEGVSVDGMKVSIPTGIGRTIQWEGNKSPGGVTWSSTNGSLTGTPEKAGTFQFKISGSSIPFQLKVDKAPLELTVQPVTKYYGEPNDNTTEQTFTYNVDQIKALDWESGSKPTDNKAETLSKLIDGYKAPSYKLVTDIDKETPADANTVPGTYAVLIQGGESSNYQFKYTRLDSEQADAKTGTNTLTILPRPILINKVTKDPVVELWQDTAREAWLGTTGTYGDKTFTLAELTDYVDENGWYPKDAPKAPLTVATTIVGKDDVELTYDAHIVYEPGDRQPGNGKIIFTMTDDVEYRGMTIAKLKLANGKEENGNYELAKSDKPIDNTARAKISKKYVTKIKVTKLPQNMDYTYGGRLSLQGMRLDFFLPDDDQDQELAPYFAIDRIELCESQLKEVGVDVKVYWVSSDTEVPDEDSLVAKDDMALTVGQPKYLCFTAGKARAYIGPFTVTKKPLELSIDPEGRYYGEELTDWNVKYDVDQLTSWDQEKLKEANKVTKLTGAAAELSALEGYSADKLTVTSRISGSPTAAKVTTTTDVGSYFLLMDGAESDNYQFTYTRKNLDGTETKGNSQFGYAPLTIEKRPILVTKITGKAGSLLHNSVRTDTVARSKYSDTVRDLDVTMPKENGKYLLPIGNDYSLQYSLDRTKAAVCAGDTLTVTYKSQFRPDNPIHPWFQMDGKNQKTVTVDITDLHLEDRDDNKNYQLLFPNWDAMHNRWVGETAEDSVATGDVWQRRIIGVTVVNQPTKTDYIYGDTLDLTGLRVRVEYEQDGSGSGERYGYMSYSTTLNNGILSNTFTDMGLTICWDGDLLTPAVHEQPISVAEHSGHCLVILGPEYPDIEGRGEDQTTAIRVDKRDLTLRADNMVRKYGEDLAAYTFSFDMAQLATWDRAILEAEHIPATGTAGDLNEAATSVALSKLNEAYEAEVPFEGPKFISGVAATTPVRTAPYPLRLTGGAMANYRLHTADGSITIEKRPIRVTGIQKTPVYTIFNGTDLTEFTTVLYQGKNAIAYEEDDVVKFKDGLDMELAAGFDTTNPALLEGDIIAVQATVKYSGKAYIPGGQTYVDQAVTVTDLALTRGGENYELVVKAGDALPATGRVELRTIREIKLYREPTKTDYTYGEAMDLSGMLIEITYQNMAGEHNQRIVRVSPTDIDGIYINYWDPDEPLPTPAELKTVIEERSERTEPCAGGDHLLRSPNAAGFAHDGKRLLVAVRVHENADFVTPILSSKTVRVAPRELTYALSAEDKIYDGGTLTKGTITLTNVYENAAGEGDRIWIVNGTDYATEPLPGDYAFSSGSYGNDYTGLTFNFTSPDVSYGMKEHDYYADLRTIPVEVTGIDIAGPDRGNYVINGSVTTTTEQLPGRDDVPYAAIRPDERKAPDTKIDLWVDEHTNTVTVLPAKGAEVFGDPNDPMNSELHYEYALVYLDGEELFTTEYQDSPYFGGEKAAVDVPEYEPDKGEHPTPGLGGGQTTDPADESFGIREPLPRGIYVGALVRLAKTNNYEASLGTASFGGTDADTDEMKKAYLAAVEKAKTDTILPTPEEETDRQTERVKGPVIQTYTYRIDLVSSSKEKNSEKEDVWVPALEEVWFTDKTAFEKEEELGRLINNLEPVLYFGYYWDMGQSVRVEFPLTMDQEIWKEIPVLQDGKETNEKKDTLLNENGTICLYVPLAQKSSGNVFLPSGIRIRPEELLLWEDDEPVQLTAEILPSNPYGLSVSWSSSDESVVTVTEDGMVTVVGMGTATITASLRGYMITSSISVRVQARNAPVELPFARTMFNTGYDKAFISLIGKRFEPERTMTRHELTVIMERFFQLADGLEPVMPNLYTDIWEEADYAPALRNLDRWGIVKGVGEERYAPDQMATRAEIAAILCRMLMLPVDTDPNAPHAYLDGGPEDTWAWAYIDALAKAGITKGTGDDRYDPDRLLTRAELAMMLGRILVTRVDKTSETLIIPSDVGEDHWAYENILRAVNSTPAIQLMDEYRSLEPETETETEAE